MIGRGELAKVRRAEVAKAKEVLCEVAHSGCRIATFVAINATFCEKEGTSDRLSC